MSKYDIEYQFENNGDDQLELVVYIDNPDGDLKVGQKPFLSPPDDEKTNHSSEHYALTIRVEENPLSSEPSKLRFPGSTYCPPNINLTNKYLMIYCATENGTKTKRKRRTSTTVSNGGGGM